MSGPADRAASPTDLTSVREPQGEVPTPGVEELVRIVALDGPAGSGKSTVARLVAERLGWKFIDTGATYRAATLAVLRRGVPLDDSAAVARTVLAAQIVLGRGDTGSGVLLDGADVSAEIRGPEVTAAVSAVSAIPAVRELMIGVQRRAMGTAGAVVEGRDIATVVAPLAAVKVYLDATPEARARRRASDAHSGVSVRAAVEEPAAGAAGSSVSLTEQVQRDLRRRDALDSQTNTLAASDGAVHLETSDLTLNEVVDAVLRLVSDTGVAEGLT